MITIVVVVIVIVLTYGSIWRQKELELTKQTLWQTGEPDLHPVSARQGAKKIMQWFALEMQHNAQNAVYCTIDAHYATQVRNKMHEIIARKYIEWNTMPHRDKGIQRITLKFTANWNTLSYVH